MFYAILGRIKYYSFFCGNKTLYRMATTEDRYISLLTDSPKDESQWYAYGYHSGDDRTVGILTSLMAM